MHGVGGVHEVEMIEPSETQGVDGAVEFCGVEGAVQMKCCFSASGWSGETARSAIEQLSVSD